ncbi:STAS domain-containing protein [Mycobacterium paraterrae]|uniref:Anti-sigma factor antagonist n=1 Tax=Mycobacterium paraterrae TaxID=577492 RepID=A0ABY3VPV4_9MYCO|nr:STAS domain-containing protein [Mycobacterium paraterrae]UMB70647.1 STAS domain-containing protein [Mycobacterium paraterrae]
MLADGSIKTDVETLGDVTVLSAAGEIDLLTCPAFKQAIFDVLAGNPAALVIDLTEVSFFSSAGVSSLVAAREAMGDDSPFAVVPATSIVGRILEIAGLTDFLSVQETREAALMAVQAR